MWTDSELSSESHSASGKVWRVVEHQHTHSTRKLVDTQEEQLLLEKILELSKPAYPIGVEHYDYLLKTPFRYTPPNRYGSRFRMARSRAGVFYASEQLRSALAETAFYRIRFFRQSESPLLPRPRQQLTAFTVKYKTQKRIDLLKAPLSRDADKWNSLTTYEHTQALAHTGREAGIQVIRYLSVRDPQAGANIALLDFSAFAGDAPLDRQTWFLYISPLEVNITRAHATEPGDYWTFDREYFDQMPTMSN